MDSRLSRPLAVLAIAVALALGVLVGMASGLAERVFGGPSPKTIAASSLESMRAQNRLVAFVARYVSVVSASQSRFGLSSQRTLILPGDVRYELDLSRLAQKDVTWDESTKTLRVRLPDVEIAGPEVDLNSARDYGSDGLVARLTGGEARLDQANRAAAVADLRKQALAELPMRLAREAARAAVERSFVLPLKAAGFDDAKVVTRFAFEDNADAWDVTRPYNEVMEEYRRKRAATP